MARRVLAQYVPRGGSEWGELAGSALNMYRPFSYAAVSPETGSPVVVNVLCFSHSINLEKLGV
jgi:hypothetical protein